MDFVCSRIRGVLTGHGGRIISQDHDPLLEPSVLPLFGNDVLSVDRLIAWQSSLHEFMRFLCKYLYRLTSIVSQRLDGISNSFSLSSPDGIRY